MRVITPQDYVNLAPMAQLELDMWIEQEGLGPITDISELREWEDGRVLVDRLLRDPDGHRYRDGDRFARERFIHQPAEPMP